MTACPNSWGALCLAMAVLTANAVEAGSTLTRRLHAAPGLRHHGDGHGDSANEYDRGHEYILAMGLDAVAMAPPPGPFQTDGIPETTDPNEAEEAERAYWRRVMEMNDEAAFPVRPAATEYPGNRDVLEQLLPSAMKTYGHSGPSQALFPSKYLDQKLPDLRTNHEDDKYYSLLKGLRRAELDSVLRKYLRQEMPGVAKTTGVVVHPIVRTYAKVLPDPVIGKYVADKFVKSIIASLPEQRQRPVVVIVPLVKNVFNLIKVAVPNPIAEPAISEHSNGALSTAVPTIAEHSNGALSTAVPTIGELSTAVPTIGELSTAVPATAEPNSSAASATNASGASLPRSS